MPSHQHSSPGTAEVNGPLWGARAEAWAEQEAQSAPMYALALELAEIGEGTRVLDVGCGAGSFCSAAAERRADVAGLDAAAALLEIARRRVPQGDFRVGDLQSLPFADGSFDAVTGFNAFQFAADPVAAFAEARRVAMRGGTVFAVVWAEPARVELSAVMRSLAALLPEPPPPPPRSLSQSGALEAAVRDAGLAVRLGGEGTLAFEWPDVEAMLRGVTSSGGVVRVERAAGEETVRSTLLRAMEEFRTDGGGYRLENDWYYVLAAA